MDPKALLESAKPWLERAARATGLDRSTLVAVLTLGVGFVLAFVLGRIARRLVGRGARLIQGMYPRGATPPSTLRMEKAVGDLSFWLVVVFTVMAATERLGLPVVSTWLSGIASFLPRVVVGLFIAALGTVAARLLRHLVFRAASSAKLPSAERLSRLSEIAILIGTGLIAIDELGIEVSFLKAVLLIVLGAILGGAALGFALGGRDLVANILSAYYVHKLYEVGQTVRIGDAEGRITRITETFVVLECAEGSVAIPARAFSDQRSTLVLKRSAR
jgi:Mechanosensitive ion channel